MIYQAAIQRVRHDGRLKHLEKLLYLYLLDLAGESGSIHMSMRALERETDISIAALSAAIPRLTQLNYIRASLFPGKTGHASYLIFVDPHAQDAPPVETIEVRVEGVKVTIRVEKES